MHVLFAHAGLHRVHRGSEIALETVAQEIASTGAHTVTLVGSGEALAGRAYTFKHVPAVPRERFEGWPKLPFLRSEFMYEELTFAVGVAAHAIRNRADVTIACGYPYTNWALRCYRPGRRRPPHVFVTQNGDWPTLNGRGEPKLFSCDGLICTNPVYYQRNRNRWRSTLIPNGVDPTRFRPGVGDRARFGLPTDRPVVLMVSALQPNKRVLEAVRATARVRDAFLIVAGDGALRGAVDRLAAELLPNRFVRGTFPHEQMSALYRSADVFLHTTIGESFGNVYIEALSSGLPVVAHDEEITRWILDDRGVLIDAKSDVAISQAIERALRTPLSQLREASLWAHGSYNWSTIAKRYLDFLSEVARE